MEPFWKIFSAYCGIACLVTFKIFSTSSGFGRTCLSRLRTEKEEQTSNGPDCTAGGAGDMFHLHDPARRQCWGRENVWPNSSGWISWGGGEYQNNFAGNWEIRVRYRRKIPMQIFYTQIMHDFLRLGGQVGVKFRKFLQKDSSKWGTIKIH